MAENMRLKAVIRIVCAIASIYLFIAFYDNRDWFILVMGIAFAYSAIRPWKKSKAKEPGTSWDNPSKTVAGKSVDDR
ncbi:hypothetical protein [Alteromonas gilva]|uniref:Uncharacterized protein n=1 Tax=Alteromonas gilva TaxID=2987522 RepID=A0ABT5L7N6_9ALTE|nr:hypothetical protein [Alteromonas gilva]MDC8832903.1 hypothetical protein [Alteromonas gilva]